MKLQECESGPDHVKEEMNFGTLSEDGNMPHREPDTQDDTSLSKRLQFVCE
jgi:hypothetical protein